MREKGQHKKDPIPWVGIIILGPIVAILPLTAVYLVGAFWWGIIELIISSWSN